MGDLASRIKALGADSDKKEMVLSLLFGILALSPSARADYPAAATPAIKSSSVLGPELVPCEYRPKPEDPDTGMASDSASFMDGLKAHIPDRYTPAVKKLPENAQSLLSRTVLKDVSTVVFSGGQDTDRNANNGVKDYFRKAVLSDPNFFETAKRFYSRLRKLDASHPGESTIENDSLTSVFPIAYEEAKGDPYLALKVMTLYGHDDLANELFSTPMIFSDTGTIQYAENSDCRLAELDRLAPPMDSLLHGNGGLGIHYSQQDVDAGKKIAADCAKIPYPRLVHRCNDDHASYRADYYHVVMSAFLACRETVRNNAHADLRIPTELVRRVVDHLYLDQARQYKIDRFREEVKMMKENTENTPREKLVITIIEKGLDAIENTSSVNVSDLSNIATKGMSFQGFPPEEIMPTVEAYLQRYSFEVDFRRRQHEMGAAFGHDICKNAGAPKCN